MKDLIYRRGDVIEKKVKKNMWVMHFKNMSGDGDHYEEETLDIEDYADIIYYIIIYATRWTMSGDRYNDNEILKAARIKAVKLGMKENGHDLYMDLTGPDVTNDQFQAAPQECWITWFNEYGYEHSVEFDNGVKCFKTIGEYNVKEVLGEI